MSSFHLFLISCHQFSFVELQFAHVAFRFFPRMRAAALCRRRTCCQRISENGLETSGVTSLLLAEGVPLAWRTREREKQRLWSEVNHCDRLTAIRVLQVAPASCWRCDALERGALIDLFSFFFSFLKPCDRVWTKVYGKSHLSFQHLKSLSFESIRCSGKTGGNDVKNQFLLSVVKNKTAGKIQNSSLMLSIIKSTRTIRTPDRTMNS